MIYLLGNEKYFVPWLPSYFVNLSTGFKELGRESEMLMDLDREFDKKDVIIVIDYVDLPKAIDLKNKLGENSPILVSHSHGSSAFLLGCKAKGDRAKEERELRAMDMVACNTEWHTQTMIEEMGVSAVYTGYPIDFDSIKRSKAKTKEKGKIVVGGRLEQDRQLFIAVEALLPYGKSVVFCCPHSKEWAEKIWGGDGIDRYEEIFQFKWDCPQEEFYRELATAEIVTTFGCIDTLNLSIIEGYTLGAYPLVPHKLPYLEYVSEGYEPYSLKDIRRRIDEKPDIKVTVDKYDYRLVAQRYLDAIDERIDRK